MCYVHAASFRFNYLIACHGLADRGTVSSVETIVVFGAVGREGSPAVQIAQVLGAKVIAVASSEDWLNFPKNVGADLAAARLRHVAGTEWSTRRYMNMQPLHEMKLQPNGTAVA
ncbi:MAG: hypothetical protein RJS97_22775 [Parvibaculaceae bacterium]